MTTQKDKIRARLKKSYYSDLLVLAASQTNIQENYMDVITNISVQFSDILRKNGFIKKLQYDPKKFWNFKGKKTIYNIDGGQATVQIPTSAPFGLRVVNYKVRPGDFSSKREDLITEPHVVTDLFDQSDQDTALFDNTVEEEDGLADDLKKMQDGTRIIFEAASALRTLMGELDWPKEGRTKPKKGDIIFLHGPLVNPAASYEISGDRSKKKFPPYSKATYELLLPHRPKTIIGAHKDKDPDKKFRKFIPVYCEIIKKLKESEVPVYGCVERGGVKPCGPFTYQILLSLIKKKLLKQKDVYGIPKDKNNPGMIKIFHNFNISDSSFFDYILDEGEYIDPMPLPKQDESKWPDLVWPWEFWGTLFPDPFATYLKISEHKKPIRIESLNKSESYKDDLSMVYHSSRLLKNYSFPVGLDIVDKLAKTPGWMRKNVRTNAIMVTMRKAMESGDKRAIALARKIAVSSDRSFFNRPKGK